MRRSISLSVLMLGALLIAAPLTAQDLYVYPEKGQDSQQQEKDKYACYEWARGQSGFDPMQRPQATTPPPQTQAPTSSAGRGLVGGALAGAVIGEIANDDAGKGAAIGAASGAIFGGARRNRQQQANQQQEQQWAQQQAANYEQQRHGYNRAYAACLEGRGYTVK